MSIQREGVVCGGGVHGSREHPGGRAFVWLKALAGTRWVEQLRLFLNFGAGSGEVYRVSEGGGSRTEAEDGCRT